MELNTAASVISYISRIEHESADFYEKWANAHEELREAFLSFARDNKKHEKNIRRAYYSVVSDALETNFCFEGLRADVTAPFLNQDASRPEVLKASIDLENSLHAFYIEAARMSRALLADVPRAMERVAKSRKARVERLRFMSRRG
jgi:rubrerythrin